MRRLTSLAIITGAVLAAALAGFAGTANASATIDLIWANTGTNEIGNVGPSSVLTLQVILTAGSAGSQGTSVSVDYSEAVGELTVLRYMSTPDADITGPLPITLGTTVDTGSRIENVNSAALFFLNAGTGLSAGQSHQLGTVTFLTSAVANGPFEIRSDANGPTDGVLDLAGNDITSTTAFNSAFLCDAGGSCPTPKPTPIPTPTPAPGESATIDLIWDVTGSDTIADVPDGSDIRLNVILTAGPNGSQGAAVSVDYSDVLGALEVVGFMSTPSEPRLPLQFTTPSDTGSRIQSISSASTWDIGTGLLAGQSHQLGTVTFHVNQFVPGASYEIRSDADGPTDDVLDLNGNVISSTTTFNSAFLCDAVGSCPTPTPIPTSTPIPTPVPTSTPIPGESAKIDLIWDLTGSDTIADVSDGSDIRLNVILTAGPMGSSGAGVGVDYSDVLGALEVVGFMSTPSAPRLPLHTTTPSDTGSRIQNISSFSSNNIGTGLSAGQSHQLGTVTFHVNQFVPGASYEIRSDADGPTEDVLDLNGRAITSTTTFNSAFLCDAVGSCPTPTPTPIPTSTPVPTPVPTSTPTPIPGESATIDLIWDVTGSDTIADVPDGSDIRLNVILTAGPMGSQGAGVGVDYSEALGLSVVSFASTPSYPYLPMTLGSTTDTGSRIQNINSAAVWNLLGIGLTAGQSHQLGTVTFHVNHFVPGASYEIQSDANAPMIEGVLDFNGNLITSTTAFNSAFLINTLPEPTATPTPAPGEAAAIELIWAETGTNEIDNLELYSEITLQVILTAGSTGSMGAGVSVDYGEALGLSVVSYESTPSSGSGSPLPSTLGTTTDTGSRIENINAAAISFLGLGTGLYEGQGQVIGTITFQVSQLLDGTLEIRSDTNGPSDGVLDLSGNDIAGATRFGNAFLINALPEPTSPPTPQNECRCLPHRVVPSGNLAVLSRTQSLGRGSAQTGQVGVVLKAEERSRGACRPGSSTDTFSLRLRMVDDDGDVILDETRTGLSCDRRVGKEKFTAAYSVGNCAGSQAPSRSSAGQVTLTATTEDGELVASRTLRCKQ